MPNADLFKCFCCGYLTLTEEPPGTFEICPVCFWEDDNIQAEHPTLAGGANKVSLEEARRNFEKFGAATKDAVPHVRRPRPDEIPG